MVTAYVTFACAAGILAFAALVRTMNLLEFPQPTVVLLSLLIIFHPTRLAWEPRVFYTSLSFFALTGAIYFDIDAGSPWVGESPGTAEIAAAIMPEAEHVISFHAVMSGSCWAGLGDRSAPPVQVNAGDVVVFPGGAPNVMSSTPGMRGEPSPLAMYYRPTDGNLPFEMIYGGGGED